MSYVLRQLRSSLLSLGLSVSAAAHLQPADLPEGFKYIPALRTFEQTYNDKVEDTSSFWSIHDAKLEAPYRPESQAEFPLAAFWVPNEDLVVINTAPELVDPRIQHDGKTLFFVHPESANFFAERFKNSERVDRFFATPLASYRSIIVWDPQHPSKAMNLKVSLDKKIGDTSRMMTRSQIERAAVLSLLLKKIDMQDLNRDGIYFIDEPLGVYLKDKEVGYAQRELPKLAEGSELAPMFSLYAKKQGKPIVVSLIERSGLSAKEFLGEEIIRKMIQHMFKLAFEEGMVGEPHEQNVMIELRDGRLTGNFYYRDLGGFAVSPAMRAARKKDMSFVPAGFRKESLKIERAKVVDSLMSYLNDSNFFALGAAVRPYYPEVTRPWIRKQVMQALTSEVFLRTGHFAKTEGNLKSAITKYIDSQIKGNRKNACFNIF